jgi:hypothetical protein
MAVMDYAPLETDIGDGYNDIGGGYNPVGGVTRSPTSLQAGSTSGTPPGGAPPYNPATLGNSVGYGPGYGQAAPGTPSNVTPMNYAGQSTGSTINATAPANIQSFGGTAQVAPTYANAATIDPANAQSYLNQYEGALYSSLQPGFEQQDQQLAQSNAARGITNSGSAGQLEGNLYGQQAAALASGMTPLVSQGFGYAQQDVTGNAANQQTVNLANAGYGNTASMYNANAYNTDVNANASAYNNYQNELLGYGSGEQNSLLSAYLNSYGPNTGVESVANTGAGNTGSVYGNVFGEQLNNQNQAYNQLGQDAGAAFGG